MKLLVLEEDVDDPATQHELLCRYQVTIARVRPGCSDMPVNRQHRTQLQLLFSGEEG
jgi:hypothetical protein